MKRIMLIEPPQLRDRSEVRGELDLEPPLGLIYMATVLKEAGYDVQVLDCFQRGYDERTVYNRKKIRVGLGDDEIVKRIEDFKPHIVGVSCIFFFNHKMAHHVCRLVKETDPGITTVMGGIYPTVFHEDVLRDGYVDVVVRNEGERSMLQVAREGIRSGVVQNPYIEDLDELPIPDRDFINIDNYQRKGFGMTSGRRFTTVLTSRGCPFRCSFCSAHNMWGRNTRFRSAENVLDEIAMLKDRYNIEEIHFIDENISLKRERFMKIVKGLGQLGIKWTTPNGIALFTLRKEDIRTMAENGCYSLAMAYESGNQDVLKRIVRKPLNLRKAKELTDEVKKRGIKTRGFFIIGFPGETKEDILDTIRYANDLGLDMVGMNTLRPYPATDVYREGIETGAIKELRIEDLTTHGAVIRTKEFSPRWIKCIIEADRFVALGRKKVKPLKTLLKEVFTRNGIWGFYVLLLALRYQKRFGGIKNKGDRRCPQKENSLRRHVRLENIS